MNSNEKLGKSVFCAVQNGRGMYKHWMEYYVSDENKSSEIEESYEEDKTKKFIIGSELEYKGEDYFYASYIVFESCIYRIGGWHRDEFSGGKKPSKTVDKLVINKNKLDCVKVAEMNYGRKNPYTVILGGKLYVVGGLTSKPVLEEAILMEVFKGDESGWETIPNPPAPTLRPGADAYDNNYYRQVYEKVIAGAFESETSSFIIVVIPGEYQTYNFYTYEENAENWMPYVKLTSENLRDKGFFCVSLSTQPAVVSDQLMLFLQAPEFLYIMDLERGNLHIIDLVKRSVIDEDRIDKKLPPYLVMIEKGKFCVFWGVVGPKCNKTGKEYSTLKGCIFTLKRKSKRHTFSIRQKSLWSSLLPDSSTRTLRAVCLVDFTPES